MLTDVFAERYAERLIWARFTDAERRLLRQCFGILGEQVLPYYDSGGNEIAGAEGKWNDIHDRLSRELGVKELAPQWYSIPSAAGMTQTGKRPTWHVCEQFLCIDAMSEVEADRGMKERVSLVELAFRLREEEVVAEETALPMELARARSVLSDIGGFGRGRIRVPGDPVKAKKAIVERERNNFDAAVRELNVRLQSAGTSLNYHNGFIQISADPLVESQVERPFWALVAHPDWQNVDTEMKEALDRRDGGRTDPAWYASKALESTIKIISDKKGFTHGGEKGAANYIDNLGSQKNAFIAPWEREALHKYFRDIRNPFGHGAGSGDMPALTNQQTDWAIENCMSWIKSLIERL